MILVITRKDDVHADIVIQELEKLNSRCFRLNTEVADEYSFRLRIDSADIVQKSTGRAISTKDVTSVYLRRRSFLEGEIDDEFASFVNSEWKSLLKNLWTLMPHALWISNPDAIERASNKMLQLRNARDLGLTVPDTLVSNDKQEIEAFLAHHADTGIIYKAFNSGELSRGSKRVIYTSPIDAKILSEAGQSEFSVCPGIYQPKISKFYEVRATVIGSKVFSAKIDSQSDETTMLDWRHYEKGIAHHSAYQLPPEIEEKIIKLTSDFGLNFGAIDLIRNDDGYVFLELNANGQWAWVQVSTGYNMSESIASLLVTK